MDVEHQVLQVGVDTCLRINCGLLVSQQVIELYNADRNRFKLLSFEHDLLQDWVFNHLVSYDSCEMASFCNIPPVITVERSIQVVSKTL